MSMSRQLLGRVSGLVSRRTVSASPALADKVTHTGQQCTPIPWSFFNI